MKFKLVAALALTTLTFGSAMAADMSGNQKTQIEGVVHDYLLKNPEVLVQSLQSFQEKQYADAQKTMAKTQQTASKSSNDIFHNAKDPVAGNPNGKVSIVEFFDYQCPHCVEMTPVIESLIKKDPEVRIVFKEFPIRGPASEMASKAALAAQMQGKYFEFHKAIMSMNKALTQTDIDNAAQSVGLNLDKFKTDMNSAAVADQIKANYKLAKELKLMGTPAFFIAKTNVTNDSPATAVVFIPGQVDQAQLQSILDKLNG